MPKIVKSQWEFGELFPAEQTRRVYSVTDLTQQVRRLLEKQIGQVWVTGEITNSRVQSSGHVYFTLKDAGAQLNCILFRGEALQQRELIKDGQKVILQGDLTVYEPRGQYQLRILSVELQGIGALQAAFEALKQKLNAAGLFAPERKRPIPRYPQRIGIVTSPTGAAIRDILHVIQRRHPGLEVILAPCSVQGLGAAQEIASGIRLLNEWACPPSREDEKRPGQEIVEALDIRASRDRRPRLDLILVTRGGGSLEDLWAFNEEIVARSIFESALPVVSAVGHEIDFTISDFVADLRAATPSEAPERLIFLLCQHLKVEKENLEQFKQRLSRVHPRRRFNEHLQRLDDLRMSLLRGMKFRSRDRRGLWQALEQRLIRLRPSQILSQRREVVAQLRKRLPERTFFYLRHLQERCSNAQARLRLLSPNNVLERGYSITSDASTGKVIRSGVEVRFGQKLRTRLGTGAIQSVVEKTNHESPDLP
jgi:exodeoxyribonuclease VII large subunit